MLLTQLPDELPAGFDRSRTYDTRGWTTFERCSAELGAKPASLGFAKWKLVIDVASDDGGAQRRLPATPERMATLLAACRFTNGADSAAVLALYEKTAKAVLGTVEVLSYHGLPLVRGDAWTSPALLAEALNYCESLRTLVVLGNRLDDEGMAELAAGLEDGALPALRSLKKKCARETSEDPAVQAELHRLRVDNRARGGAEAVARALNEAPGAGPQMVDIEKLLKNVRPDLADAFPGGLPGMGGMPGGMPPGMGLDNIKTAAEMQSEPQVPDAELRKRVLSGALTPKQLVVADPDALATDALRDLRREMDERSTRKRTRLVGLGDAIQTDKYRCRDCHAAGSSAANCAYFNLQNHRDVRKNETWGSKDSQADDGRVLVRCLECKAEWNEATL